MTDTARRQVATKASVFFWAAVGVDNLVIADGTNTEVLTPEDIRQIEALGVNTEQLRFRQNERILFERGKGVAEGELIDFAISHSRLLEGTEFFYKCTGKLFCRNFPDISALIAKNTLKSIFWQEKILSNTPLGVDTRFFYTSKAFFRERLLPGYRQANDFEGRPVEITVTETLNRHCKYRRSKRPFLTGFSGGHNRQYREVSYGDMDSRYPCWIEG